ncbi:MAG TPA: hypothetical protein VGN95_04965 [Pyrinomonadaceae bacterium]|nr:hypothetical protein [Pyrinomonadaceae bacterium]
MPIDTVLPNKQALTPIPTVIVSATASSQRVRYASLGEVHQTRLQVFSTDGTQVFDSDFRLGNLIDWQLADQQGTRLMDGSYLFLVTVKDFSNNLTQKYGVATLEREQVSLAQSGVEELTSGQAAALEANKLSATLSPVDRIGATGLNRTSTASTDGESVIDANPAGKKTTSKATTTGGTNATGTGTQNKIAKWTDNAGTLGDSTITEDSGGAIGMGTAPDSSAKLNIFSPFGVVPFKFTQNAANNSSPTLALFSTLDGTIGQYAATTHNGVGSFVMGATPGKNFGNIC